jgi:hypothetical protein
MKNQPINTTARSYKLREQQEVTPAKAVVLTIVVFVAIFSLLSLSGLLSHIIWGITPQIP